MPIVKKGSATFNVTSSSGGPIVTTPWMPCAGTDYLRLMRNIQGTTANCTTQGAYQTTSVLASEPDAWVPSGATQTGNAYATTNIDLSAVTDKALIRGGIFGASSGQDGGQAEIVGMVEGKGELVASGRQFLNLTSGVYHNEIAVTPPIPLVGLAKAMATFDVEHQGADFYLYPVYRLLANDPNAGGAWTSLASPGLFTASGTYNSGEQTLGDDTTKCWAQLGLKWKSVAGSAVVRYMFFAIYS